MAGADGDAPLRATECEAACFRFAMEGEAGAGGSAGGVRAPLVAMVDDGLCWRCASDGGGRGTRSQRPKSSLAAGLHHMPCAAGGRNWAGGRQSGSAGAMLLAVTRRRAGTGRCDVREVWPRSRCSGGSAMNATRSAKARPSAAARHGPVATADNFPPPLSSPCSVPRLPFQTHSPRPRRQMNALHPLPDSSR